MITPQQVRQQIAEKEAEIQTARREVEIFDPRVAQTQTQLLRATPQTQAMVRQQESLRQQAKTTAFGEIAKAEEQFQQERARIMPQVEAYESAERKANAWQRIEEAIGRSKYPGALVGSVTNQIKQIAKESGFSSAERNQAINYYRNVVRGEASQMDYYSKLRGAKEIGLTPVYEKGELTGFMQEGAKVNLTELPEIKLEKLEQLGFIKLEPISQPTQPIQTTDILSLKPSEISLPYQTRGTISQMSSPVFMPKYNSSSLLGFSSAIGKGVQTIVFKPWEKVGGAFTERFEKGPITINLFGKDIPLPIGPPTPPIKGIKTESVLPLIEKIPRPTFQLFGKEVPIPIGPPTPPAELIPERIFTPKQIGKGVETFGKLGVFQIPFVAPAIGATFIPTGLERGLSVTEPKMERPEGITNEDWAQYEKDYTEYSKAMKTQKVMGFVEAGIGAGILGTSVYKSLTKPIIIKGKPTPPQSLFKAGIEGSKAKIEILTVTPGRAYIKTTPFKEALFWGTGKRIDLATKLTTPTKLSLTQAELLVSPTQARGITVGDKIGDITKQTIKIPVKDVRTTFGQFTQPSLKAEYLELFKKAPTRTIKPFELQAVRSKVVRTQLTPVEKKILGDLESKVYGVPKYVKVSPEKGTIDLFKSDVITKKGVPVGGEYIGKYVRLTKVGKGFKEFEILGRPPTTAEVSKSIQLTRVRKQPLISVEGPGGKEELFRVDAGVKGFTKDWPIVRGRTDQIPGLIKVKTIPPKPEPSTTTFFQTGGKKSSKEFWESLRKEVQLEKQLQVPKPKPEPFILTDSAKSIQIQKTSEIASVLAKKTRASQIPKVVQKESLASAFAGALAVIPSQKELQKQKELTITKTETAQKSEISLMETVSPITPSKLGEVVLTAQVPTLSEIQVPRLIVAPVVIPIASKPRAPPTPPAPTIFKPPIPILEEDSKRRRRYRAPIRRKPTLFFAELRRRGKFRKVTKPTSFEKALGLGKTVARTTLGATIRIRRTTGELVPLKPTAEFRWSKAGKDPFKLVEVKQARLSTLGERAEILRARRGAVSLW